RRQVEELTRERDEARMVLANFKMWDRVTVINDPSEIEAANIRVTFAETALATERERVKELERRQAELNLELSGVRRSHSEARARFIALTNERLSGAWRAE